MKKTASKFQFKKIVESKLFFPIVALVLILLFDLFVIPGFFKMEMKQGHLYGSFIDVLRNSVPIMVLALGMTLVIATGGIDISVGATMAIASSVACILMNPTIIGLELSQDISKLVSDPTYSYAPLWMVIGAALLVGAICGLWNGLLVTYGKIQPMVATLILMIAGRGIAQLITNAVKIIIFNDTYAYIGNGWILLPFSLYIAAFIFAIAWLLTRKTSIGLFIESVGANSRSSFFAGINEKRVKLFAYIFCGFCAGVAALIVSSSIRTSDANQIGLYMEMDAILAVIIGGTSMSGGRFSFLASIIGALVIQATTTSTLALGVPASAIIAVKALVVIIVIILYSKQVQDITKKIFGGNKQKEIKA
jgi:galactofuranose transport system permease protein